MSDDRLRGGRDPGEGGVQPKDPTQPDPAQARWERVKTLMEAATALSAGERTAFLIRECGGDQELREEIESLLQFHDEAGDFIESPPDEVQKILSFSSPDPNSDVGRRMGNYQIVRELGRGGMGIVYLAVRADEEFEKRVAIKVVRRGMESEQVIRRFRNERQILARLEHANIARLIDGGTTVDGLPYFIMEYVEGAPINEYCDEHRLSIRDRLQVFLRACDAVQYAHERSIVHRDLKPTNILVKENGTPKLLDFGIAKWVDSSSGGKTAETTVVGVRMLTPAYASPEQLRGESLTAVSDVFSLGVVLHELLCGRRPGGTAWARRVWGAVAGTTELPSGAVWGRTLTTDLTANRDLSFTSGEASAGLTGEQEVTPAEIAECRQTTPEALSAELAGNLDRIILKAIRFNPADRYDSVAALAGDLRLHLSGGSIAPSPGEKRSIIVLPFRVLSRDAETDDYLGLALADAVTTKLSNLPNISVSPTNSALRSDSEPAVDYALEGRIHKAGDRVRIAVQLLRMRDRSAIWAAQFDESLADLLTLEDSISGQVALALIPQLSGELRHEISKRQTSNPKAYQDYLKGRWHWSQNTTESLAKALQCFMQSIAEDPQYASAHVGVADYYVWLGVWGALPPAESFAAAKVAAHRALEIDYGLADAHASLGFALWANDRDLAGAERELRLSGELNANCVTGFRWLGLLYARLGRGADAAAAIRMARSLDASSPALAAIDAFCRYQTHNVDEALEAVRTVGFASPQDANACEAKTWCYLRRKNPDEALTWARRAAELSGRSSTALAALTAALAASGAMEEARRVLAELQARAAKQWVSPFWVAMGQNAVGDTNGCLDSLHRGVEMRDWWVNWIVTEPAFDNLRSNRKFARLVQEINTPRTAATASSATPRVSKERFVLIAAVVALVVIACFVVFRWFHPTETPFENVRIAKLTTNGVASHSAISPDGKYVAYVSNDSGKPVLWLRQVSASGSVRLPTPDSTDISRIAFSGDGLTLSFIAAPRQDPAAGVLYKLAVPGGSLRVVMRGVSGPASLSPDTSRLVLLRADPKNRRDELVVMQADGSNARVLASRNYPDRFSWPSTPVWSHDGKLILCGAESTDDKGFHVSLAVVNAADGSMELYRKPRWQFLEQATWSGDDRGFVASGRDSESSFQQIWYIPYPSGEPRRLTNDFSDYTGLTVTADSNAIVSVQMQTLTNIYILRTNDVAHPVQITPGTGRYFDLAWTSKGEILYSSDASGTADIWTMNADGSGQKQLTASVGRNYAPAASPNGDTIVFHSNRTGNWNLWRINPDGSEPKQLTFGPKDSNWPRFTPDGQSVVYHHTGNDGMWNLFSVPIEGGEPKQVSELLTMYPGISPVTTPDGIRIACWYSEDAVKPRWKAAILSMKGGPPMATFELPPTVFPDTPLRWTPDGRAISFVDNSGGAANIWVQPIDGTPRRPVTDFKWGQIYSFDWAKDGRLAYSRGLSTSDVVILRNVKNGD